MSNAMIVQKAVKALAKKRGKRVGKMFLLGLNERVVTIVNKACGHTGSAKTLQIEDLVNT